MSIHRYLLLGIPLLGVLAAPGLPQPQPPHPGTAATITKTVASASTRSQERPILQNYARLPLSFEVNHGQTDRRVRFMARGADSTLFLTPTEAVFTLAEKKQATQPNSKREGKGRKHPVVTSRSALQMRLVGADPKATAETEQPLAGTVNYFIGRDPSKWHAGVPTCARARFRQVYPGVDVVYYGNQQHLEYDFVVAPHADPNRIRLRFAGTNSVRVDRQGDLLVGTKGRTLTWRKPTVYQEGKSGRQAVGGRFRLDTAANGQTQVKFALGHYDSGRPLIIDPVLIYSTYLGGSSGVDGANGIAIDSGGIAYITGQANSSDFPITPSALQTTNKAIGSGSNTFVAKLNPTGTALIYSTFLGGSGRSGSGDIGNGIAIDSSGSAYVTGSTYSADFPVTPGAFQTTNKAIGSGTNAFVAKLNPTGTALIYSTYLGGRSSDGDFAGGIAIDSNGNAYITGATNSSDFPVTLGTFQTTNRAPNSPNAFVTKLNAMGTALIYSTFLGGSGRAGAGDFAWGIAIDSIGNAYITGGTSSSDFPVTSGAFQATNKSISESNAFVTKLNSAGTALVYSTFLGGSGIVRGGDHGYGISIDSGGNAYVTGDTNSSDFPVTPGAFQTTNKSLNHYNAFVTKLNPTGTSLVYSTFLGGSSGGNCNGIAVDSGGNAYVAGESESTDFPVTVGAFQMSTKSLNHFNAFVTKLNVTGTALVYSTFLGGSNSTGDLATSIAVDSSGNAFVTGWAESTDFPVTPGAFQTMNKAANLVPYSNTGFVTKLSPVPIFPDFNNDGHTDLFLQNASTNAIISWFMNGSTFTGGAYFSLNPPSDYALIGTGDFGGAGLGITTLVFQSSLTNKIIYWYTGGANKATITGGDYVNVTPPAGWKLVGIGDFNGDGKSDLVVQNQTTFQIAIYFMSGPFYQGGVLLPYTPPVGWKVAGVGDFNGDGFTDIAFQIQSTGQIALWYMHGTTYFNGLVMPTVPPAGWKVVAVGDYNGDGVADLVFQSPTSNQGMVWYLSSVGGVLSSAQFSTKAPAGWNFAGPR